MSQQTYTPQLSEALKGRLSVSNPFCHGAVLTREPGGVQVRDALGLTYDVSFELSLFDRLRVAWFVCHVTSPPKKINEALDASLRVLRGLPMQRVTPRELLRARRTVLTRHESEMKVRTSPS